MINVFSDGKLSQIISLESIVTFYQRIKTMSDSLIIVIIFFFAFMIAFGISDLIVSFFSSGKSLVGFIFNSKENEGGLPEKKDTQFLSIITFFLLIIIMTLEYHFIISRFIKFTFVR